jgi:4-hydroxy-tetrahydrodipicolinate synthase
MPALLGVNASAITPRGKDGEVALGAAFELIDHLSRSGIQGIVLFGATGEYPAFTEEERSRLVYLAVKRSRVPVLVGVGSATLDASVGLAREARDAGAAGLILPPPLFFQYGQDEIREFYLQFASHIGRGALTLIANTPRHTSGIAVDTAACLLETGMFAGLVDSSGSETFLQLAGRAGHLVLTGSDASLLASRLKGMGVVSNAACAIPELIMALDRAISAANQTEIDRLGVFLRQYLEWAERFPEPVAAKAATGWRGLKTGPPAVPLSPEKERDLDRFGEWFRGCLPSITKFAVNA